MTMPRPKMRPPRLLRRALQKATTMMTASMRKCKVDLLALLLPKGITAERMPMTRTMSNLQMGARQAAAPMRTGAANKVKMVETTPMKTMARMRLETTAALAIQMGKLLMAMAKAKAPIKMVKIPMARTTALGKAKHQGMQTE